MSEKYLNKLLVARTAQGAVHFAGICYSYCDAPTVGMKTIDGGDAHWRADLCEVVEMPQEVIEMLKRKIYPEAQPRSLEDTKEK